MAPALRIPRSLVEGAAKRLVNPSGAPSDRELREAVEGEAVLVTGASHGIGRATALKLGEAGARVALVARSGDELEQVAAEIGRGGGEAHAFPADLTELDAIPALAEGMADALGTFEVVVSNAGHSIRRSVRKSYDRFHDYERTVAINYLGPVRLLLELLPAMRERGSGHVVNTSTLGVIVPPAPNWTAYLASKTAFDVWLRAAGAEMHRDGVTVTSVYLGLVHTRMSAPTYDASSVPGMSPEEAADLMCRAIVERPPSIAPWWASGVRGFDALARRSSDALMRNLGRRFG